MKNNFNNLVVQEKRLRNLVGAALEDHDTEKVLSALSLAKHAHEQQFRDDGGPYIIHPIRAACTLLESGIQSTDVLSAMLLHDVVEDTGIAIEEIQKRFGKKTATLVENVTRPRALHETEKEKKEAKINKFKVLLAADRETRLIKCADMLDNIQSWSNIPKSHPSRKKLARWYLETEAYSIPIAEKTDPVLAQLIRDAFSAAKQECGL